MTLDPTGLAKLKADLIWEAGKENRTRSAAQVLLDETRIVICFPPTETVGKYVQDAYVCIE
jgi:hypothetical protein